MSRRREGALPPGALEPKGDALARVEVPPGLGPEPMALGVCLPVGRLVDEAHLVDASGRPVRAALTPLHRWPDASVSWLLVEAVVPPEGGTYTVVAGATPGEAPAARPTPLLPRGARLVVELPPGRRFEVALTETQRRCTPLHTEGRGEGSAGPLKVEVRTTHWPAHDLTRVEVVVHNPQAARHVGGLWDLGDAGSVGLVDVSLLLPATGAASLQAEPAADFASAPPGTTLFQASSGGERWDCENHVDASGRVRLAFRGYRCGAASGLRAQPTLRTQAGDVALREFWQHFPKALRISADALEIGLFPREHAAGHELQGGERKRHTLFLGPAGALAFIAAPRTPIQPVVERLASGALHGLSPAEDDRPDVAARLARIVDPADGLAARRERIDEFGWRHFGDLWADHEATQVGAPDPFVSHYNNQYDCVEAFLRGWMRSGDARWFTLADSLARHVVDIDLYHTTLDRAAYAGGQFWHTDHYVPARTSTHRCYSAGNARGRPYGGGPSNEQNYPSGLWLHHLLTGDPWSREAALQLARWTQAMDDGARTPFVPLSDAPTGAASQTYSPDFHGPGRGAGNSINALCDAWWFTGDAEFLTDAERLIARCVHPDEPPEAHDLLDAERRWSYVVFLKYLLKYLHRKELSDQRDAAWRYARAVVVRYAAFMVACEGPSTRHPERLEFVTETWPAQDLRKAQVVHAAAAYADPALRPTWHAWADAVFDAALAEVATYPTADRCRPLVLTIEPAIAQAYARRHPEEAAPVDPTPEAPFPPRARFVPQKAAAKTVLRTPAAFPQVARAALKPGTWRPLVAALRARLRP